MRCRGCVLQKMLVYRGSYMRVNANFSEDAASFNPRFEDNHTHLGNVVSIKGESTAPFNPYFKENDTSFNAAFDKVRIVEDIVEPAYGNTVKIGNAVYQTLGAALKSAKSGDTIVLLSDVTYNAIIYFTTAFCLDLNGNTLTAKGLAVLAHGGSIVDNGEFKGLLKVPKGFLVMNHAVYGMLPVWNEEDTGYIFAKVTDQFKPVEIINENSFVVEFRPSITGSGVTTKDVFCDGVLDNEIIFKVNIVGYDESGNIVQTIALPSIDEELVSRVYTNSTSFKYTVNGMSRYVRTAVELAIETESGLVYRSEMGSVENNNKQP